MLKKTMTYEDYNGETVTEDFYFNLSKAELVELELSEKGGFSEALQDLVKTEDGKLIIAKFKQIIMLAVGKRSEDGRRFVKNDEIRDDFAQTEAYSDLFFELATDAGAAANFINGIVPAQMAAQMAAANTAGEMSVTNLDAPKETSDAQLKELDKDILGDSSEAETPRVFEDYNINELLEMPESKFVSLVGKDPQKMTKNQLMTAMRRKTQK